MPDYILAFSVLVGIAGTVFHALTTQQNVIPLPVRAYYAMIDWQRAHLGKHPLERILAPFNKGSRREHLLICFFVYFFFALVIGTAIVAARQAGHG